MEQWTSQTIGKQSLAPQREENNYRKQPLC